VAHGARPVHQIISMIKWIRTSKLSLTNSLYAVAREPRARRGRRQARAGRRSLRLRTRGIAVRLRAPSKRGRRGFESRRGPESGRFFFAERAAGRWGWVRSGCWDGVPPKPETRTPKPETRNPKPGTRNPRPETRNPNPETETNPKAYAMLLNLSCVDEVEHGSGLGAFLTGRQATSLNSVCKLQKFVLTPVQLLQGA